MWAISMFFGCTVMMGCMMGQRDEDAASRWLLADTKAECEARNEAIFRELVEGDGDTVMSIRIVCAPVGT